MTELIQPNMQILRILTRFFEINTDIVFMHTTYLPNIYKNSEVQIGAKQIARKALYEVK